MIGVSSTVRVLLSPARFVTVHALRTVRSGIDLLVPDGPTAGETNVYDEPPERANVAADKRPAEPESTTARRQPSQTRRSRSA